MFVATINCAAAGRGRAGACRSVGAGCADRAVAWVQFMASGQREGVTATSCSVRPDLRAGKADLDVIGELVVVKREGRGSNSPDSRGRAW